MSEEDITRDATVDADAANQPGYSVRLYSPASDDHHDNEADAGDNEIVELHDTTPV